MVIVTRTVVIPVTASVTVTVSAIVTVILKVQGVGLKKKKKNFTSFGQPTRLITCANNGNT